MYLKSTIIVAALLIAPPSFAQQAAQQDTPNFILGHGFLPPAPPSRDYPPGHTMTETQASLRGGTAAPERAAQSRNGTDAAPVKADR